MKTYRHNLDNPRLSEYNEELLTSQAVEMALKYEFVTPWTSMIVVDDTVDIMNVTDSDIHTGY